MEIQPRQVSPRKTFLQFFLIQLQLLSFFSLGAEVFIVDANAASLEKKSDRRLFNNAVMDSSCFSSRKKIIEALRYHQAQVTRCANSFPLGTILETIDILKNTRISCEELSPETLAHTEQYDSTYILPIPRKKDNSFLIGINKIHLEQNTGSRIASVLFHEAAHLTPMNNRSWHDGNRALKKIELKVANDNVFEDRIYLAEAVCFPHEERGRELFSHLNKSGDQIESGLLEKDADVCLKAFMEVDFMSALFSSSYYTAPKMPHALAMQYCASITNIEKEKRKVLEIEVEKQALLASKKVENQKTSRDLNVSIFFFEDFENAWQKATLTFSKKCLFQDSDVRDCYNDQLELREDLLKNFEPACNSFARSHKKAEELKSYCNKQVKDILAEVQKNMDALIKYHKDKKSIFHFVLKTNKTSPL